MSKTVLLYKDLLTEIDILEFNMKCLEKEYKNIQKKSLYVAPKGVSAVDYESERVTGGLVQIPAYDALGKADTVMAKYNEVRRELREKYFWRDEMKEMLDKLEGLEYKVAYKKHVEGKRLHEIADELGYSYPYIRKVHMRIEKEGTKAEQKSC